MRGIHRKTLDIRPDLINVFCNFWALSKTWYLYFEELFSSKFSPYVNLKIQISQKAMNFTWFSQESWGMHRKTLRLIRADVFLFYFNRRLRFLTDNIFRNINLKRVYLHIGMLVHSISAKNAVVKGSIFSENFTKIFQNIVILHNFHWKDARNALKDTLDSI